MTEAVVPGINILDLSDDVLLHIFKYISSYDMLNILRVCKRFRKVGTDRTLWNVADFRGGELTARRVWREAMMCLQPATKYLFLKGGMADRTKCYCDLLTAKTVEKITKKCPNLTDIKIYSSLLDAKKLKVIHFHGISESLKVLSLVQCALVNIPSPTKDGSYFRNIQFILPYLEKLEITNCSWLTDYDLMVLSKLDNLKFLNLSGNVRIGVTMAYVSIGFRFGFKSLENLNMRGTSLRNADVQSIVNNEKLKVLKIGPIDSVKRINEECTTTPGLVMAHPDRTKEPTDRVVIINIGPNGPMWKKANKEELVNMGLDWVMNGICQDRRTEKLKNNRSHYFVDKDGKPIADNEAPSCSKRKKENSDENPQHKKKHKLEDGLGCNDITDSSDSDADSDNELCFVNEPEIVEMNPPDDGLNDSMLVTIGLHAKSLEELVVSGCAITDTGLYYIIDALPNLKIIDVSGTSVTNEGLLVVKALRPDCDYIFA